MKHLVLSILVMSTLVSQAQTPKKTNFNGYLKDMVTWNMQSQGPNYLDNLIHNRLNFQWFPNSDFKAKLELRNRIFFGELASDFYPLYADFIDVNNDYFDLSWMPVNEKGFLMHMMIDRASVEWNKNDWEITVGRQRINWGKNLVWNPNDIFNTYSFFDFDYEERPGSDAILIQKYTGFASGYQFAIKMADSFETLTAAGLYSFNTSNYDFQVLGGLMNNNVVLGTGWAGNLSTAGLKGEITYFSPIEHEEPWQLLYSFSVDYSFPSGVYLNGSMLYNSLGARDPDFVVIGNTTSNIDVRNLSPFRYSTFFQVMYPASPLLNTGLSMILYPGNGSLFLNPFVTYSLKQDLDLDVIGQLFFEDTVEGSYGIQTNALYARLKWSF